MNRFWRRSSRRKRSDSRLRRLQNSSASLLLYKYSICCVMLTVTCDVTSGRKEAEEEMRRLKLEEERIESERKQKEEELRSV